MSNRLVKRIEKLEEAPAVQREQRLIDALTTHNYSGLSDEDFDYLDGAFREKYGNAYCDRMDAWFATLSNADLEAISVRRWDDLSEAARQSFAEIEHNEPSSQANRKD